MSYLDEEDSKIIKLLSLTMGGFALMTVILIFGANLLSA